MLLTGHKTRAIFDRYYIVNEQELLSAGDQQTPAQDEAVARARRGWRNGATRHVVAPRADRLRCGNHGTVGSLR